MTVHHVVVVEPDPLDPDESGSITLHHVSAGKGCGSWLQECREPHLWLTALWAIADDLGTDQAIRDLADGIADDAECDEHVWHGQPHTMTEDGWCVPVDGCALEWAGFECDIPPDLPPGVYAVTYDAPEWGETPDIYLTDEPVPDPEAFL